jgi:hypothetical protein
MDIESHFLVDEVVRQVQQALRNGDQPAIALLEGDSGRTLSNSAYLRDPARAEEFERSVAREAETIGLARLVLAVPLISTPGVIDEDAVRFRNPNTGPLREDDGEQHVIVWALYDEEEGVSCGMAPYSRKRDGTPVFDDDPDGIFSIALNPGPGMPGLTVLRELLDENLQRRTPR